ncbi:MAG: helix-turn-helix domain-containing protein [Thermodesulfobacteriota bacterium]|nr:helix-turn-helix domain-containing protein [Thermodesulfobacteriota bacterium]
MKRYANAEKILPKELFDEVQEYHTGILWIPSPSRFYKERRQLVIALREQGVNTKEIAQLAGVTTRRVNQILAARRRDVKGRQVETASSK